MDIAFEVLVPSFARHKITQIVKNIYGVTRLWPHPPSGSYRCDSLRKKNKEKVLKVHPFA